jgi:glycosyltransferase involved in cell wall biosynthesis
MRRRFVSIGIPTYNRADGYLRYALKSALDQNYEPIEIIVSDNCSTDDTESMIKSYKDSRIRYFRQAKNISANDNFNFCLNKADGEYFLLLHDDDMIDADLVQTCMEALNDNQEPGVIISGTRVIDGMGNEIRSNENELSSGVTFKEFIMGWLKYRVALYLCSTLYNTQYLKEIGGYHSKHNLYQDVIATARLASMYGQVHCRPVKASFRLHGSNRGDSAGVMNWCEDCLELIDLISTLLKYKDPKLSRLAQIFFSKQCYGFATNIPNPIIRLWTYHKVYKAFQYAHSPRQHIRRQEFKWIKTAFSSIKNVKQS